MAPGNPTVELKPSRKSPKGSPLAGHGISLPGSTLRALEKRGIYCFPGISVEHQHLAKRYVLRATESGGAVKEMGRYCAYVDSGGAPVPWLQPIDSFAGNGRHAIIISAELVRVEMLRIGHTYDLAISRHTLALTEGAQRPVMDSSFLFRARQGTLATNLWDEDQRSLRNKIAPIFYSAGGEIVAPPAPFEDAVRRITWAVCSLNCKRAHFAVPRLLDGVSQGSEANQCLVQG